MFALFLSGQRCERPVVIIIMIVLLSDWHCCIESSKILDKFSRHQRHIWPARFEATNHWARELSFRLPRPFPSLAHLSMYCIFLNLITCTDSWYICLYMYIYHTLTCSFSVFLSLSVCLSLFLSLSFPLSLFPHNIPNCMKEVTWLSYGLCTNGHQSAALGWLPFILPPVFVHAAVIRSW